MLKLLTWTAGTFGFLYAIYRFGYWHEAAALAVLFLAGVWILGGAFWITRGRAARGVGAALRAAKDAEMRSAAARAVSEQEKKAGAP